MKRTSSKARGHLRKPLRAKSRFCQGARTGSAVASKPSRTDPRVPASLATEHLSVTALHPDPHNARVHGEDQLAALERAIRRFGFTQPIVLDDGNVIAGGHARWEVAKRLKMSEVPCVRLRGMSAADRKAYAIAENRLAELAGWDRGALAAELDAIVELDVDYDLTVTGFTTPELDNLQLGESEPYADADDDETDQIDNDQPAVTRSSDLWLLGQHRLLCADARDASAYERVLGGASAALTITDPPYNVHIDGHVSGKGRTRHAEFAMATGEMTPGQFEAFLATFLQHCTRYSRSGTLVYVFMDWRHLPELLAAGRRVGLDLINTCVWVKTNAGMGSLYRSQHELVLVFAWGKAKRRNNVQLGRHGRNRSNVWQYAGANSFRRGRMADLAAHPTVKPVALVADAILDVTDRGDAVLDPFAGSGTAILACERTGRRACAIELEPRYVDVAIRRWEARTGLQALHEARGQTFAELAQERGAL